MHIRSPPPGFFANKTGAAAGELLTRMKPFSSKDVSFFLSIRSSSSDMLYKGPQGPSDSLLSVLSNSIRLSTPYRCVSSLWTWFGSNASSWWRYASGRISMICSSVMCVMVWSVTRRIFTSLALFLLARGIYIPHSFPHSFSLAYLLYITEYST